MEILYFEELESTQLFLVEEIKKATYKPPLAVVAKKQIKGIGSRGNSWSESESGLYLSIAILKKNLPKDLKIESCSIYFGTILIEILQNLGSKAYLKWPNDLYIDRKKIGGIITNSFLDYIVCGIGLNRGKICDDYEVLDITAENKIIVEKIIVEIKKEREWKEIFRIFEVEFHKSRTYEFNNFEQKISLFSAVLNRDGSISVNGKNHYSLR